MSCPQIVSSQTHNILHLIVPHVKANMILHNYNTQYGFNTRNGRY